MRSRIIPPTELRESPLEVTVPKLLEAGGWGNLLREARSLSLEIGLGKDPHLIERAAADPDGGYVGLEYCRKKLDKILSKAHARGVSNLRVLRANARDVLHPLFADASLSAVYVFFPDPWPKKRHHKKRFIQPDMARMLAQKLAGGGRLELRTDDLEYRAQMLAVLDQEAAFENRHGAGGFLVEPEDPARHIATIFERKFRATGKPIYYLSYRRLP